MTGSEDRYDVVVVGGGHNGLTAAAYLARAGRGVLVLERADHVGGAAVSAAPFPGVEARLSRYSYLVSLLPREIVDDLGLDVRLARRRFSSCTPDPAAPDRALLVDELDDDATRRSFARVGAAGDHAGWTALYADTARLARAVFPTLTRPLPTRAELRTLVGDDALWDAVVERPIGAMITERLATDLVRGVVATDGLIGTLARSDAGLDANRCFLYHVIGNGTGRWDVPVGGMGTVSDALDRAARRSGARIVAGAEVTAVEPDGRVTYVVDGVERTVTGRHVLAGVAPAALERLCPGAVGCTDVPQGAQVKVNLLVRRLPRLRDATVAPEAAFGGTLHVNETWTQLDDAHAAALAGEVPAHLPCEVYCHTLTDPTILSPALAAAGVHTLTVFGLQVPGAAITPETNDAWRERLRRSVLASLASVLAEPVEDLLLTDATGAPCLETRTTLDLERALGMPGGHIFHGPLAWPFLEGDGGPSDTPARRWGVATRYPRVLRCGAGVVRGGGVSGIGGHNAAMAVLEAG